MTSPAGLTWVAIKRLIVTSPVGRLARLGEDYATAILSTISAREKRRKKEKYEITGILSESAHNHGIRTFALANI